MVKTKPDLRTSTLGVLGFGIEGWAGGFRIKGFRA